MLYVLMAATIILIVPYTQIDPKAAFAAAFQVPLTLTCAWKHQIQWDLLACLKQYLLLISSALTVLLRWLSN